MEEAKLQALADSLSGHGGRKGLGTRKQYSWVKSAESSSYEGGRQDGLPNNQLYSNFVKAGTYDPNEKLVDGDGRAIKRDFSDIPVSVDDEKKIKKARKKLEKKRLKLEAKKAAKLAEKKTLKKSLKNAERVDEQGKRSTVDNLIEDDKKRKRDKSVYDEAPGTNKRKVKKAKDVDQTKTNDGEKKREKKKRKKKKEKR